VGHEEIVFRVFTDQVAGRGDRRRVWRTECAKRGCNASCTLLGLDSESRAAGTTGDAPMDVWYSFMEDPSYTRYILLHGRGEFLPTSLSFDCIPALRRAILGELGRNEDDLSHCPLVSGSFVASAALDGPNVRAPGHERWLGRR
jgi:hypothetical protein